MTINSQSYIVVVLRLCAYELFSLQRTNLNGQSPATVTIRCLHEPAMMQQVLLALHHLVRRSCCRAAPACSPGRSWSWMGPGKHFLAHIRAGKTSSVASKMQRHEGCMRRSELTLLLHNMRSMSDKAAVLALVREARQLMNASSFAHRGCSSRRGVGVRSTMATWTGAASRQS